MHAPPALGRLARQIASVLPPLNRDVRVHGRILRVLSREYPVVQFRIAERYCTELGWPCVTYFQYACRVFLARTPQGLVFGMDPPSSIRPEFHGAHITMYAHEKSWDMATALEWNTVFSLDYVQRSWACLPEGATPLVGVRGTAHRTMADLQDWREVQVGLQGWSGIARSLPEAVSIDPTNPDGFGSCMIVVRQGRFLALLITARDEMPAWTSTEAGHPLPHHRLAGLYEISA